MKILHVITSLHTGGAEKLMVDLLPRMHAMGHEVELCIFDGDDTPFKRKLNANGIRIIEFDKNCNVYNPKFIFRLRQLIKQGNYDIVHSHNYSPQLFSALASYGSKSKFITTEHNTTNRRRAFRIFAMLDKWMYSRYDHIICISDKTEQNLRDFIHSKENKISTIYNGIDVETYASSTPSNLNPRKNEGDVAILQVAAFRPQKDQDATIRAMKYLPKNFHLYLVGDGERASEIRHLISSLNLSSRVHMMGIRSDVPSILKAADVAVMSSHWEGFGLAAVEAMAAGTPVIASNVDGLAQVVDGAGVLFPEGDEKALAEEIMKISSNSELRKILISDGAKRAKIFGINAMAQNYLNIYKGLL